MGVAPSEEGQDNISHRHITINGEVVNIPSYHLKPGDKVAVRENLVIKTSDVLYQC
jgi:small subunit ribosomal protein S4